MAGAIKTLQFSEGVVVSAPSGVTRDFGSQNITTTGTASIGGSTATYVQKLSVGGVAKINLLYLGRSGGGYDAVGYNAKPTSSTDQWEYGANGPASWIHFNNGRFTFYGASSGTAGNPITKTELASLSETGNFELPLGNFIGRDVTINDDQAVAITPGKSVGFMMIMSRNWTGYGDVWGTYGYQSGTVVALGTDGSLMNVTTGVLSGTTGTDGFVNISNSGGVIYIENRRGGATAINILLFGR